MRASHGLGFAKNIFSGIFLIMCQNRCFIRISYRNIRFFPFSVMAPENSNQNPERKKHFESGQKRQFGMWVRIPTVKLKIPEKAFLNTETRTSVTFKLQFQTLAIYQWQWLGLSKYTTMKKCEKYKKSFPNFFMVAYLLSPNRCHWQIDKINLV